MQKFSRIAVTKEKGEATENLRFGLYIGKHVGLTHTVMLFDFQKNLWEFEYVYGPSITPVNGIGPRQYPIMECMVHLRGAYENFGG